MHVIAISCSAAIFVRHHYFETGSVRTKVCQVYGITVPEACGAQQRAIMGDGCRADDYLVISVVVYVAYRDSVNALPVT